MVRISTDFRDHPHRSRSQPLTILPSRSRYVALKFIIADPTYGNNEAKIHHILASQPRTHPGSDHVLTPLGQFQVHGPNGEHVVLVFEVIGPQLSLLHSDRPHIPRRAIKPLTYQIALGISFLHNCGVVHGGRSTVLSTGRRLTQII